MIALIYWFTFENIILPNILLKVSSAISSKSTVCFILWTNVQYVFFVCRLDWMVVVNLQWLI